MPSVDHKALMASFDAAIHAYLPEFRPFEGAVVPVQSRLYLWKPASKPSVFLLFYKVPARNRFGVSAAWSQLDRYPSDLPPMAVAPNPRADIEIDPPTNDGEFKFTISQLWKPHSDGTFRVGARDLHAVEDVVRQIRQYLLPYISQLDVTRPGGWARNIQRWTQE